MILRTPRHARRMPRPGIWLTVMLLFWITLLERATAVSGGCPKGCNCLGNIVFCNGQKRTEIPYDLPVWTEQLFLQDNLITEVRNESLRNLTSLTELDVGRNLIVNAKEFMLNLPSSIKTLRMNDNKMVEFDMAARFDRLTSLDLRSNRITQIQHLDWSGNLTELDLSDNQLQNLNTTSWPSSLTKLRLNHNRITTIPKNAFTSLTGLIKLEMKGNGIIEVESLAFHGLKNVTDLSMEDNAIRTLNDGCFYSLSGLKRLTMQRNGLTSVRKTWLYGLDTLEYLNLERNKIEKVDGDWEFTKGLKRLDLSRNSLATITRGTFSNAGTVTSLDLSRNNISRVADDAFKDLQKLESLELSENPVGSILESTTSVFKELKSLRILRMKNTESGMVSNKAFSDLKSLQELDLSGNEIAVIDRNAFRALTGLRELSIQSKSLVCHCDIQHFLHMVQTRFSTTTSLQCALPTNLFGRTLLSLTPKELQCFTKPRPVVLKGPTSNTAAIAGTNITLTCSISFPLNSSMAIRWKKDTTELDQPDSRWSVTSENNDTKTVTADLVIRNVDRNHTGSYQCIAANYYGSVTSNKAKITSWVRPTIITRPQDVDVRLGSSFVLRCSAVPTAKAKIAWSKEGGDFPAASQKRLTYASEGGDEIRIVKVTLEDAGIYTCNSSNPAGHVELAQARVKVTNSSSVSESSDPFRQVIRAGEQATMYCTNRARGQGFTWRKNGNMLLPLERIFHLKEGPLVITGLTESDSGLYQCQNDETGDMGELYVLEVLPKIRTWWDYFEDKKMWTWLIIVVVIVCVALTSLVWIACICYSRRKIRSGGSSTGTDETILPDECNPINGLHPDSNSSLDSPLADYNEYLAVGSEYSSVDAEYPVANSRRSRSYSSQQRPCLESLSTESPSFANYLTLKAHKNKGYAASPHRSCNTLPRALR